MSGYILDPNTYDPSVADYFTIPTELRDVLQEKFNKSQIDAIQKALRKNGITLIQGPPGTGKTTTIIGILSSLINSQEGDGVPLLPPLELVRLTSHSSSQAGLPSKQTKKPLSPKSAALRHMKRKAMPWLQDTRYSAEYCVWFTR